MSVGRLLSWAGGRCRLSAHARWLRRIGTPGDLAEYAAPEAAVSRDVIEHYCKSMLDPCLADTMMRLERVTDQIR